MGNISAFAEDPRRDLGLCIGEAYLDVPDMIARCLMLDLFMATVRVR